MKGRIEKLTTLDELISKIPDDEKFTAFIEDWDEGLKVINQNGAQFKIILNNLKNKYGSLFFFRLFSESFEISWNGEEGIRAEIFDEGDYEIEEKEPIYLETDYARFPGLESIKPHKKVEVQLFKSDGNIVYMKFKKLS